MIGYSDSDFVDYVHSHKSTSGYIFMMAGGAVSWRSVKKTLTATSTMEAEFVSCFEATSNGVWIKSFISGVKIMDSIFKPKEFSMTIQLLSLWLRTTKVELEVNTSILST